MGTLIDSDENSFLGRVPHDIGFPHHAAVEHIEELPLSLSLPLERSCKMSLPHYVGAAVLCCRVVAMPTKC